MSPSRLFILRPVATSLLMAAIMLVGMFAYRFLPLSALPEVDYPTIQVQTFYPGASPDVMTSSVTAPLEVQLGQMPGLNQMSSTSSAGASVITLQFSLDLSLDVAEQEVQAAINAAGNLLPSDLPAPPIYAKVNPADAPILTLALTSKTLPLTEVEDLADTRLAQKISQLPGVGLVSISGGHRPAVRIQANIRQLAAYGLNIDDLRTTIATANVNTPKGNFDGPSRAYTINANDQIRQRVGIRRSGRRLSQRRAGAAVRCGAGEGGGGEHQARRLDEHRSRRSSSTSSASPAPMSSRSSTRIQALLPQLKAALPAAVDVAIVTDRTTTIRASVADVEFELGLAVVLVVAVIFLFLRSPGATLIPSLSVPLSLVGTLAVMYLAGFSLNNLSLMALTIATGFVVDDAIVMIENISRYIEAGDPPLQAALKGSAQIGFTIISLTVSLIAVLIPLLFMPDVVGRLFREFAITLAVTIVISAVVALTLVPMLCAKILRHHPPEEMSLVARKSQEWFDALIAHYGRLLDWVLDHQPVTLVVAAATLGLTVFLYIIIPKGFFPVQDTGLIQGISVASPSVSFAAMAERQQALAAAILEDPDVESLSSFIGVDGTNTTLNSGRLLINLKPRGQRSLSASEIIRRLDKKARGVTGIALYMQPVQDLTIDATVSRSQYQFALQDANPDEFAVWIPKLIERLRQIPQIEDVATTFSENGLSAYVLIDRATAARFGITPATIDNALYDSFGQRIVSTIFTQSNQYRVILEADPSLQQSLDSLGVDLPAVLDRGRRAGAAVGDRQGLRADRALGNQSPRTVSGDHGFIQPGGRRLARRGGRRDQGGRARDRAAGQHDHRLPGRGAGVSGGARQRADPDPRRDRHDVHRAGRALRELHPPDHDPVDPAFGRGRRAAGADDRRQRSERDRDHRHHPVDRHRQEERDHDGRFRPRRRAQRGQVAARGDLSGVPLALPPDPDDDDGGALCRLAADARHRHGLGAAPSARRDDRRRADRQPAC